MSLDAAGLQDLDTSLEALPTLTPSVEDPPAAVALNNKRTLALDSSPEGTSRPAPFATGSSSYRATDGGAVEDDSFGNLHFGGRSTGMGPSTDSLPVIGQGAEQPTRKRARRGPEDSPPSYITSPAESDHSSAPAITSPAEDDSLPQTQSGRLRDQLAQFKVDSAPSSSASSAYGGDSFLVANGGQMGKAREGELDTALPEPASPPRPLNRLVRGKKPNEFDSSSTIPDNRSPLATTSMPPFPGTQLPYSGSPTFQTGSPSQPPTNYGTPIPQIPAPRLPQQAQTPSSFPPLPAEAQIDQGYQSLLGMVGTNFKPPHVWYAWKQSNSNTTAAIAILVGANRPQPQPSLGSPLPMISAAQQQRPAVRIASRTVTAPSLQPRPSYPPSTSQFAPNNYAPSLSQSPHSLSQSPQILSQQAPLHQQQAQLQRSPQASGYQYSPQQLAQLQQQQLAHQQQQRQNHMHLTQQQHQHLMYQQQQQQLIQQQQRQAQGFAQLPPGYPQVQLAGTPTLPYPQQSGQAQRMNPQFPPQYPASGQPVYRGPPASAYAQYPTGQYLQKAFPPQNPHQMQHSMQSYPPQNYRPRPPPQQSLMLRTLAAAQAGGSTRKKKRANVSESDGDGGEYSDGSGDEYGGPSPIVLARRETLALEFFNGCPRDDLMELTGCNPTQATLVIKLRPFESAVDFRSRTRKQKGVGNNLFDNYLEVVTGMAEVDKVLSECEQIGAELSKIMKIWASGAAPDPAAASRPATPDVGLNLVDIPAATAALAAETSHDPAVRSAFQGYLKKQPEGVPDTIVLKDYQMLGLNWLNLLYHRKTSCILADEMGLGKTAQVIALMAHLKSLGEKGPHLVIVPSSTLENWMREFSVFAPGLRVESYYGSQAERAEIRHELRSLDDLDVVVTTYNIATSSIDDQKFLKKKMDFKICVFDEGHQLKNSESKKYKDLMQIRAQWRLLLTGTPLQNNLQELVSLLSFILPDQFRDANESLRAIFKVSAGGSQSNLLSRERISRAKKMMTPFVLRRKKAQVLKDLPTKSERIEFCDMTDLQRDVYNEALTRSKMALLKIPEADIEALGEDGDVELNADEKPTKKSARTSSKTGNKSDATSGSNVLIDLRKASNHPMLFRRIYTEKMLKAMAKDCLKELEFTDRDKDLIFEDMEVMTDFELHRFCFGYKHLKKYCLQNEEWMSAGKVKTLLRLLPDLKKNGDRVLLFSQFTQVLDILEVVLDTMEIRYMKLTGQTNVTERQGMVDEYSNDPEITVFLLSTRAGGLGLNLTAANTVIFYDQDFNPHNDLQAEDRSYRIGQTRDVTVIKLITKGSVEEDMRALATHKLLLDASVSGGSHPTSGAAAATDEDAGSAQAEKRMRTSLLSNLKKKFVEEESASQRV